MGQIKKNEATLLYQLGVFNIIDTFISDLTYCRRLRQKLKRKFGHFLVQMRTRKFALEIN